MACAGDKRLLRKSHRHARSSRRGRLEHRRDTRVPRVLGKQRHCNRGVLDERLGNCRTADLLGNQHEVDARETQAARGFRREQSRQSQLAVACPPLGSSSRVVATFRHAAQNRG